MPPQASGTNWAALDFAPTAEAWFVVADDVEKLFELAWGFDFDFMESAEFVEFDGGIAILRCSYRAHAKPAGEKFAIPWAEASVRRRKVDEKMTVLIDRLRDEGIQVRGDAGANEAQLARYLSRLEGQPLFNRFSAERYLLLLGDLLASEHQHRVLEECIPHLREIFITERPGQVDPNDLGTDLQEVARIV